VERVEIPIVENLRFIIYNIEVESGSGKWKLKNNKVEI